MSHRTLTALYDGRVAELPALLKGIEDKRRPSKQTAMIVLGRLADRYRDDRGYVDETIKQIAKATDLPESAVEACLQAFDHVGITRVVRTARRGSAPRRELPFLAEAPADGKAQECGTPRPDVAQRSGVDAVGSGVEAQRSGVSTGPPRSSPPVISPSSNGNGTDGCASAQRPYQPFWTTLLDEGFHALGEPPLPQGARSALGRLLRTFCDDLDADAARTSLYHYLAAVEEGEDPMSAIADVGDEHGYSPFELYEIRRTPLEDLSAPFRWEDGELVWVEQPAERAPPQQPEPVNATRGEETNMTTRCAEAAEEVTERWTPTDRT